MGRSIGLGYEQTGGEHALARKVRVTDGDGKKPLAGLGWWVNVVAVGIVAVVIGVYVGSYLIRTWDSSDDGEADLGLPPVTSEAADESNLSLEETQTEEVATLVDQPADVSQQASVYKVQVGAFADRDAASAAVPILEELGYPGAWVVFVEGSYRVQVGAFSDPANASRVARDLERAGYAVYIQTG